MNDITNNQTNVNTLQVIVSNKRKRRLLNPDLVEQNTPPYLRTLPYVLVNRWKVPIHGSVYDPRSQKTFELALECWRRDATHPDGLWKVYGIGVVLYRQFRITCLDGDDPDDPKHPLTGEDLLERQGLETSLWYTMELPKKTYMERSGSEAAKGFHCFMHGEFEAGTIKCTRLNMELYCDKRMLILTGESFNTPSVLWEGQAVVDELVKELRRPTASSLPTGYADAVSFSGNGAGNGAEPVAGVDYGSLDEIVEEACVFDPSVRTRLNTPIWTPGKGPNDWSQCFFNLCVDLARTGASKQAVFDVLSRSPFVLQSYAYGHETRVEKMERLLFNKKSKPHASVDREWIKIMAKVAKRKATLAHGRLAHEALQENGKLEDK